jgi:FkbM family methyltransferase
MVRVKGADQIAAAMATDGWLGFERPLPDVFAGLVRARHELVLDVGANSGFYSLVAVSVDASVEVHAFEPYPPVLELLRANLAVNHVGARVRVFGEAVAREAGTATLHVPDPSHGLIETSASLNPEFRVEEHRSAVTVSVTTLDDHVRAVSPNRRVGVVKIDVESLEHDVLAGATEIIARDKPYIVVEVLPTSNIEALESIRASCGLVDVRLRPTAAIVSTAIAFDPHAWNHLFVREDQLHDVLRVAESCGLEVQR